LELGFVASLAELFAAYNIASSAELGAGKKVEKDNRERRIRKRRATI